MIADRVAEQHIVPATRPPMQKAVKFDHADDPAARQRQPRCKRLDGRIRHMAESILNFAYNLNQFSRVALIAGSQRVDKSFTALNAS